MSLDFGAQCLSLNFDGLTRRAINQRLEGQKRDERCVILDDSTKITSFFGRDKMDPRLWGVLKLRGDIFYAVCETSGCPLQMVETAVYELSGEVDPDHQDGPTYLSCPKCFNERNLQISFPGYHLKEQESEDNGAQFFLKPLCSIERGFWGKDSVKK